MDDDNEIDFDELLAQMREKIRRKKESETGHLRLRHRLRRR